MIKKSESDSAVALGARRFYGGGDCTPASDPALTALLENGIAGDEGEKEILDAWLYGWDVASGAANDWQS